MVELVCGCFENLEIYFRPKLTIADCPDNLNKDYTDVKDKYSYKQYVELLRIWITKCCQITDGPVFFIPNQKWTGEIESILSGEKIKIIQRIHWIYNFGQHQKNRYAVCNRPIYWLNSPIIYPDEIRIPSDRQLKYKDKRANPKGKMPTNIWQIPLVCGTFKERRKWHPCQLPIQLVKRIVQGHSKEKDLVFDPFVGSGTSMFASIDMKRDFIGFDASQTYITKLKELIQQAT